MTTYSVSTTSALIAAAAKVKNGDTILLAGGTYSNVKLNNIAVAGNVTITAADANRPVIFTDLLVKGSSGLTLQGLEFAANPAKGANPFQVVQSSNVVLDRLWVHGTLNGNPDDDVAGMLIRDSKNVTLQNGKFEQLQNGVGFLDNDGLKVLNNSFTDMRTDGMRGGGTSNLTISGNFFSDFYPRGGSDTVTPDHPDAIQLWTTNTTTSARNITITDNVVVRGKGDPIQGIFLRDTFDQLPYQNVTITGNTVVGGAFNGISVDGANKVVISDNHVIGTEGQKSNIRVENTTAATVTGNEATGYQYINSPVVTKANNVLAQVATEATAAAIAEWTEGSTTGYKLARGIIAVINQKVTALGYVDTPGPSAGARAFAEIVVSGTDGADRLAAPTTGNSRVEGGAGNDTLTGHSSGTHQLIGGTGDDTYIVKGSGDLVIEAAKGGNDTVSSYIDYRLTDNVETLRVMAGGLTSYGNALDNRIVGSAGADILYGEAGDDLVQGSDGDDQIYGGEGADDLRGDGGNDLLDGGEGNDLLQGGAGNDVLLGGAGNDVLDGGVGNDTMSGGAGKDVFRFRSADIAERSIDTILDFTRGQDKIDLGAIDAKAATAANEAFAFIGTAGFHKVAGELRYQVVKGDAHVSGDVNGDGVADFTVVLKGITALAAGDFTL